MEEREGPRPIVFITRRETFSAAHRLVNPAWDEVRNEQIFGKDTRLHGHTYTLEVTIKGEVDPDTGMVLDLRDLRDIIRRLIIDKADHADLNGAVDFLRGRIPSAENIVVACWEQLALALGPGRLHRLRLWESENNSVEYFGQ